MTRLLLSCLLVFTLPVAALPAAPAWWASKGVTGGGTASDYAAANQGQLKNMAVKARDYFNETLPGGAGPAINTLVDAWAASTGTASDYAALNQGQLKAVARPFYDRLIALGIIPGYPWTTTTADDQSYAMANLGQLKNVFAFDFSSAAYGGYNTDADHLPDAWERTHFSNSLSQGDAGDFDGDGISNLQEFLNGTDPENFFNGEVPVLEIISGNDQVIEANTVTPQPFVVKVKHLNGTPWPGAPVAFLETAGAAQMVQAPVLGAARTQTVTLAADANGLVSHAAGGVYYSAEGAGAGRRFIEARASASPSALAARFTVTIRGLMAEWLLNENSGTTAADSSGSGNPGSAVGSTTWADGVRGNALQVNGGTLNTHYGLDVPTAGTRMPLGGPFTLSFWFKARTLPSGDVVSLFCNENYQTDGFRCGIDTFNDVRRLAFWSSESGGTLAISTEAGSVAPDTWYHAVIVYTAPGAKLYLNGQLKAQTSTGTIVANQQTLWAGSAIGGKHSLDGLFDEIRLWNKILTSQELAAMEDADGPGGAGDGLPDWWELKQFGTLSGDGTATDSDGDGISDHDEFQNGTNPDDFFNGQTPVVEIVSGNSQTAAPGEFAEYPLVVKVHHGDAAKTPYANAPVTYAVTDGSLALADSPDPNALHYGSVERRTGMLGKTYDTYAQVPATTSTLRSITVTAGTGTPVTFTILSNNPNVAPSAPTNVQLSRLDNGDLLMSWQDNADNEDSYIVERSDDNGLTWVQVATAPANSPCAQISSNLAGSAISIFHASPQNTSGSSPSAQAPHPGTTPPNPNHDSDGDGVKDGEDKYPADKFRWQDIPALGLAWIDMSTSDATVNVKSASLDDAGYSAYMFRSRPSSETEGEQFTTKTWANGTATLAQTITLDTPDKAIPFEDGSGIYFNDTTRVEAPNVHTSGDFFLTPEGDVYGNLTETLTSLTQGMPRTVQSLGDIDVTHFWSGGTRQDLGLPLPFETTWKQIFWRQFEAAPWVTHRLGMNLEGWSMAGYFGAIERVIYDLSSTNKNEFPNASYIVKTTEGTTSVTLFGDDVGAWHITASNIKSVNSRFTPTAMNDNGWAIGWKYVPGPPDNILRFRSYLWNGKSLVALGTVDATGSNFAEDINNQGQAVGAIYGNNTPPAGWIWKGTTRTPLQELLPEDWREQIRNIYPCKISNAAPGDTHQVVHILFWADSLEGPGTGQWTQRFFRLDLPGSAPGTTGRPAVTLTQVNDSTDSASMSYHKIVANGSMAGLLVKTRDPNGQAIPPQNQYTHAGLFIPADLAVDANRDGVIHFGGNYNDQTLIDKPVDKTSQDKPFRFWVNDDHDELGVYNEGEEDDAEPTGTSDTSYDSIYTRRDLEDWSRLWIYFGGLHAAIKNGDIEVGLEWRNVTEGSPEIRLKKAVETDGDTKYVLGDEGSSPDTTANSQKSGEKLRDKTNKFKVDGSGAFIFKKEFWSGLTESAPNTYLIFEGAKKGKGQLQLVFYKNGQKIGDGPGVWLELLDIEEMYDHYTVGDYIGNGHQASEIPATSSQINPPLKYLPETEDYILFVHGWRMKPWERRAFAETAFKRLWWQGYKGRFGLYSWPTEWHNGGYEDNAIDPGNYDRSEFKAWHAAAGLRARMQSLNQNGKLCVFAHSMGNIVLSEALRLESTSTSPQRIAKTCVTTQAASVAHCYNPSAPNMPNVFGTAVGETPNVYLNYTPTGTHYFSGITSSATIINFHNTQDYALKDNIWGFNQQLKPDHGVLWQYLYDDTNGFTYNYLGFTSRYLVLPADRYEIFSFAAEARSKALGRDANTGSVVTGAINLNAGPYNFSDDSTEHSAQFRSWNMKRKTYWKQLLRTYDLLEDE
jgi:hypothetical protein